MTTLNVESQRYKFQNIRDANYELTEQDKLKMVASAVYALSKREGGWRIYGHDGFDFSVERNVDELHNAYFETPVSVVTMRTTVQRYVKESNEQV